MSHMLFELSPFDLKLVHYLKGRLFYLQHPGPNIIKLFTAVIYK
jgi:hypothetical protein